MISVAEARSLIDQHMPRPVLERRALKDSIGMTLAETIGSDRDLPPFDRVAMDGIAITDEARQQRIKRFHIAATAPAGSPALNLSDNQKCIEVMTGAPLPIGAAAVIPVERLRIDHDGYATITDDESISEFANIHRRGSDCRAGTPLISAGSFLTGPRLSIAASVGAAQVLVNRLPRVSVICTGNELVGVDAQPEPHQIRECNSWPIVGALQEIGLEKPRVYKVADDPKAVFSSLEQALNNSDIVLTIGGVSRGRFDYVPSVLADLGVAKHFHRIAQKPGKPLWFGTKTAGPAVFGLPGNPTSVLVTLHAYVVPALRQLMHQDRPTQTTRLGEDLAPKKSLTTFVPIQLIQSGAEKRAFKVANNGSGDFASLTDSCGFVELESSQTCYPAGSTVRFYAW